MIAIECDACERRFEVGDDRAGQKVPCPQCGDVNRVPESASPESAGLPPEHGPEVTIAVVRPAMFRAKPFRYMSMVGLFVGGLVLAIWAWGGERTALSVTGSVLAAAAMGWFIVWWIITHWWVKLTITNKRTIRHEGIIRRHTSEVLHDHVRNVSIRQRMLQRIMRVGSIGISSSGQSGIEIEAHDMPGPYQIKSIIDQYRDM